MENLLLPIFALLTLAVVATHGALPPEVYWKSVLPNTPIPKAVTDVLHPDWAEEKSTAINYGRGGVSYGRGGVNYGKGGDNHGKGGDNRGKGGDNHGKGGDNHGKGGDNYGKGGKNYGKGGDNYGKGGNNYGKGGRNHGKGGDNYGKGGDNYGKGGKNYGKGGDNYGKGGDNYGKGGSNDGKGGDNYGNDGKDSFVYNYAATATQLHDDTRVARFFKEDDLHYGTKLDLHFTPSSNQATFLPRQVADSIPFSSSKVDDVFTEFSIKPESEEANAVKNTLSECEETSIKGEEKYCATSLESMVDFSTSKLGKNLEVLSTEVNQETGLQQYTIAQGVKKLSGDKAVVCHKLNYPYAVFYCHKTETTRTYSVPLEGANGIRVKAVALCHTDTSQWNPKHLAFQVLNVKPGTVPVCHFLPEDHVVWVQK